MRCPTLLATDTRTGGAIDTVTGLGAVLFGGSRRNSFADYLTQTSSGTVTEQGTYFNGSFSLSSLTFTDQATASFTSAQSASEGWSGSYTGNDVLAMNGSGTTTYSESGQGSYARGSFSLSSYVLTGTSLGTFGQSESGTAGGKAFAHNDNSTSSVTVSEQGTFGNGSWSFSSYSTGRLDQQTQSDTVGSNQAAVSLYHSVTVTGTGTTGTRVETVMGTYTSTGGQPKSINTTTYTAVTLAGHDVGGLSPEVGTVPHMPAAAPDQPGVALLGDKATPALPVLRGLGPIGPGSGGDLVLPAGTSWAKYAMQLANALGLKSPRAGLASAIPTRLGSQGLGMSRVEAMGLLLHGSQLGPAAPAFGWIGPWGPLSTSGVWGWLNQAEQAAWNLVSGAYTGPRGKTLVARKATDPLALASSKTWDANSGEVPDWVGEFLNKVVQDVIDLVGGALDTVTFGLTKRLRDLLGLDGLVDETSDAYRVGTYWGQVANIVLTLTPLGWVSLAWKAVGLTASAWNFAEACATGDVAGIVRSVATAVAVYLAGSGACWLPTSLKWGARGLIVLGAVGSVQSAIGKFSEDPIGATLDLIQTGADLFLAASCFTGEMLLDAEGGKKRADSIREGDRLWARDENDPAGPLALKEVEEVFIRVSPVWNVHVAGQILRTIPGHRFFVVGRGWVQAQELQIGDFVCTRAGLVVPVEGVADSGEVTTVYNWRIAQSHTYFVSASECGVSIWAHNAKYRESKSSRTKNADKTPGKHPWSPTYKEAPADSHHIIQDAAARGGPKVGGRPGYSRSKAPAEPLGGPSTEQRSPHYNATRVQDQPGGGTYGAERRIGYKALRRAGKTPEEARAAVDRADRYFIDELGWTKDTILRIPGNRH